MRTARRLSAPVTCPHCGFTGQPGPVGTHIRFAHDPKAEERFWARVDRNGPNGCWVWTGYTQKFGHGWMGRQRAGVQRGVLAHRYAWELLRGPLSPEDCLLHHCDNPPCVNPDHLYIGDRKDNAIDMVARGRDRSIGERNWHALLTDQQADEIRRRFKRESLKVSNAGELAKEYGVDAGLIWNIVHRRTYNRDITPAASQPSEEK